VEIEGMRIAFFVLFFCGCFSHQLYCSTIYFDLCNQYEIDENWNTISNSSQGVQISNAIDSEKKSTSVSYNCVDSFASYSTGGDSGITVYPVNAGIDSFYLTTTNNYAKILIGGLTPGNSYDFKFFGSRASSGPRALNISIGTNLVYLDAAFNKSNVVSITGVTPDSAGIVAIEINLASNSNFGYLGVIEIEGIFDCPIAEESGFFVAPWGIDSNPGTKTWPVKTLQGAKAVVSEYKSKNDLPEGGLHVYFRGGKYFVGSMTTLINADSGYDNKPVIYQSYPGETARVVGGIELNPADFTIVESTSSLWSRISDAAKGYVMQIDLSAYGLTSFGTPVSYPAEIIMNQQIMQMARWPNESYVQTASPVGDTNFSYTQNNPSLWANVSDIWILGYLSNGYFCSLSNVSSIDSTQKLITLSENPLDRGVSAKKAWCALNVLEELDRPGEYFIDKSNKMLYFWPPADINNSEIIVTSLGDNSTRMLDITGSNYIQFKDLVFEGCRGRIFKLTNSNYITYDNCTFRNSGGNGITNDNSEHLTIRNCSFYDLGRSALVFNNCGDRLTLASSNDLIVNNSFSKCDRWKNGLGYSPAIYIFSANDGITIRHNLFTDIKDCAINITGNQHLVEFNRFHNCSYEVDDLAAIYGGGGWAGQQGNIFRYNEFYNIHNTNLPGSYGNHGVHCVYFDMGGSGGLVSGNILHTVDDRAFICNGGRDNVYKNNVIVNGQRVNYSSDWVSTQDSCTVLGSISAFNYNVSGSAWYDMFTQLRSIPACTDSDFSSYKHALNCSISTSIAWNCSDWTSGAGMSYYSVDTNTLLKADPCFVDEPNLVLALRDNSPAYSIPGFKRIPWEQIGQLDLLKATRGIPLDGASEQASDINLYWAPALDAKTHKVYIGEDEQEVANRSIETFIGEFSKPNCTNLTLLKCSTYYWVVDEYDENGILMGAGDILSFQTADNRADFNHDCKINFEDYVVFANCWLETSSTGSCNLVDINSNGLIDANDLRFFAENWLNDK
jgi:hypothetical protein